jgi:predicted PurR-regulated permease PerM
VTVLDRAAWLALRLLVVGLGVVAAMWVAARLRVVLIPIAVALLVAAPLRPVAARLERVGLSRSLAAVTSVLALLLVVGGALTLAGRAVANDAEELTDALEEGVDDIEDWLVDGPVDMERSRVEELRDQLGEWARDALAGAADQAVLAAEVIAGLILALVLSVFAIRDGDQLVEVFARRAPPARAQQLRAASDAVWTGLRRYLFGCATLGLFEAVTIGTAVAIFGSPLAIPVAVFTFLAAFVPLVGAIAAGVVAVLASLVTGGLVAAVVVAVVALVVQQLDNDILAPVIYGRAVHLHPAVVLVSITAGTAIAGLAGAILAVPLVSVGESVRRAIAPVSTKVTNVGGFPPP